MAYALCFFYHITGAMGEVQCCVLLMVSKVAVGGAAIAGGPAPRSVWCNWWIGGLVLCLGWNVRLIVSLPRRYDVMTLRKPIVTWYVKTFRNVNYVC